ncbi:hypothetical protein [Acetobacterium bakii]|uniref:Uncharacterized protein n=1 Tax=Acetobacterium bakii TaxID=52689 RepID=A0A0L6TX34_9FIRM|nr:hypothetical protein [Acetobacterium bakii]KNZ40826.1 hypothetical protein AKG39_15305 [Acetobacterium bakii]
MNQYTINDCYPMLAIGKKIIMLSQKLTCLQFKAIFEQSQKTSLNFFKKLWSDINIKNHVYATNMDFNPITKTKDKEIPETIDTQGFGSLDESMHKLSAFEELFLSNYSLAMNDFGDTKIKESYSDFARYL